MRRHVHLPNSGPEQRLLLRGSTEPFSAALDALAGLLAAAQPALVLQVCGPCPSHGMRHSDFGTGSHVYVAFVRLLVLKRTMRRCLLGS